MGNDIIYFLLAVLAVITYYTLSNSSTKSNKKNHMKTVKRNNSYTIADRLDDISIPESTNATADDLLDVPMYNTTEPNQFTKDEITGCRKTISIDQFNKDFFNFRDKTYDSGSLRVDAVDKILELQNNPEKYNGMKIKDIYDDIVMPHNEKTMKHYDKSKVMPTGYSLQDCNLYTILH